MVCAGLLPVVHGQPFMSVNGLKSKVELIRHRAVVCQSDCV